MSRSFDGYENHAIGVLNMVFYVIRMRVLHVSGLCAGRIGRFVRHLSVNFSLMGVRLIGW